ncbi:MAG: hypothetical protein P4L56_13265 [Candidatus Sulfopaludibacter sp.]|nr:hypothetical protein [Candidatus Sulfopaludibacter sp.]
MGDRKLTSYIKGLHAGLLRHQDVTIAITPSGEKIEVPLESGVYKTLPNSPTIFDRAMHEYDPPEHFASEMDSEPDLPQSGLVSARRAFGREGGLPRRTLI